MLKSRKAVTVKAWAIIVIVIIAVIAAGAYAYYAYVAVPPAPTKIVVAYDVGGRGDKSFNDMAYLGATKAGKDFGVKVDEITPRAIPEMEDVLRRLSKTGEYKIILCIGFLWTDALAKVSGEFPDQKFGAIDVFLPDKPNVLAIVYRENEGCALVGALASLVSKTETIGNVLGMEIPVLWKFEIGYKYGAQYVGNATGKTIKVLWHYTGKFDDPSLGRESAISMLDQKADIIFAAAGATGLGALKAVSERAKETGEKLYAIGVDANQDWMYPGYIIASMMKRVDVGVYKAVEMAVKGPFTGGLLSLGIKEGGIGVSDLAALDDLLNDPTAKEGIEKDTGMKAEEVRNTIKAMRDSVPSEIWQKVDELKNKIMNGEVNVPVPGSADEVAALRLRYG